MCVHKTTLITIKGGGGRQVNPGAFKATVVAKELESQVNTIEGTVSDSNCPKYGGQSKGELSVCMVEKEATWHL